MDDLEDDVDEGSEEAKGLDGEDDLVAVGEEAGEGAVKNNVQYKVENEAEDEGAEDDELEAGGVVKAAETVESGAEGVGFGTGLRGRGGLGGEGGLVGGSGLRTAT